MTCRGKIIAARRHAALVEDVQACAPPVTAPYLRDAYARMKLDVRVRACQDIRGVYLVIQDPRIRTVPVRQIIGLWNAGWPELCGDPAKASAAYLRLCKVLTEPAATVSSRPNRPGAAQTAGEQSPAPLSPSVAPSADDAPSRRVCGDVSPGIAAPISVAP